MTKYARVSFKFSHSLYKDKFILFESTSVQCLYFACAY